MYVALAEVVIMSLIKALSRMFSESLHLMSVQAITYSACATARVGEESVLKLGHTLDSCMWSCFKLSMNADKLNTSYLVQSTETQFIMFCISREGYKNSLLLIFWGGGGSKGSIMDTTESTILNLHPMNVEESCPCHYFSIQYIFCPPISQRSQTWCIAYYAVFKRWGWKEEKAYIQ